MIATWSIIEKLPLIRAFLEAKIDLFLHLPPDGVVAFCLVKTEAAGSSLVFLSDDIYGI